MPLRKESGGGGRTRTYEGLASGFTVRPLCRSGHSPTSARPWLEDENASVRPRRMAGRLMLPRRRPVNWKDVGTGRRASAWPRRPKPCPDSQRRAIRSNDGRRAKTPMDVPADDPQARPPLKAAVWRSRQPPRAAGAPTRRPAAGRRRRRRGPPRSSGRAAGDEGVAHLWLSQRRSGAQGAAARAGPPLRHSRGGGAARAPTSPRAGSRSGS